ncbi:glycosyltransferase family 4 protein [soil metagenome]
MHVLVLSPTLYDTSPAMRFRFEQWARYIDPADCQFTFAAFADEALHKALSSSGQHFRKAKLILSAFRRRLKLLPRLIDFDVVFIHREATILGPAFLERLIHRRGIPIVYDFDDPIWMPYSSPTNGMLSYLKWSSKVAGICRLATAVTAGNRLLADWSRQLSNNVHVVPSTVDLARYPEKQHADSAQPVTLGWTGSHSTLPFLEELLPTLARFAATQAFRLQVISHTDCYQPPGLTVEVESKKWRADSEAEDLLGMDIGLAPFPDKGWTPWRCHGKILQYMAAGIPTVASPIGIVPDYIQDGVNGFLAASPEEWIEKLGRLARDRELRQRIGSAGRATIRERYSAEVWAPRFLEILRQAKEMGAG